MDIGLSAFIRFANASERARPRLARRISEEAHGDYSPATDFWRPMRQAIARDRKTSRDGSELRRATLAAPALRRSNFEAITEQWEHLTGRWTDAHHAGAKSRFVELGGTRVRLSPLFAEEWDDGHGERAHVWFNKEELSPDTVRAVRRLLRRGHETAAGPDPVFIDLRRGAVAPSTSSTGDLDDLLDDLGDQLRLLSER